jgi:glycolate oxidase
VYYISRPIFFSQNKYAKIPSSHPVLTGKDQLIAFAKDQSEVGPYLPDAAIRLSETADEHELVAIITHCARHKIPVTPQGGLTGLTGGALPEHGGLVLSCLGMTGIDIDPAKR